MAHQVRTVHADRLLAAPGREPAQRNAQITLRDGTIESIGPGNGKADIGGPGTLVIPGLANAHDHGRGLTAR